MILRILVDKSKSIYHQNNTDGDPNRKYVGKAKINIFGIKMISPETVYYSNGTINNTPEDMGTVNLFDPTGEDRDLPWIVNNAGHMVFDVVPYFVWGNAPDDSTTAIRRIGTGGYIEKQNENNYKNRCFFGIRNADSFFYGLL